MQTLRKQKPARDRAQDRKDFDRNAFETPQYAEHSPDRPDWPEEEWEQIVERIVRGGSISGTVF